MFREMGLFESRSILEKKKEEEIKLKRVLGNEKNFLE